MFLVKNALRDFVEASGRGNATDLLARLLKHKPDSPKWEFRLPVPLIPQLNPETVATWEEVPALWNTQCKQWHAQRSCTNAAQGLPSGMCRHIL